MKKRSPQQGRQVTLAMADVEIGVGLSPKGCRIANATPGVEAASSNRK